MSICDGRWRGERWKPIDDVIVLHTVTVCSDKRSVASCNLFVAFYLYIEIIDLFSGTWLWEHRTTELIIVITSRPLWFTDMRHITRQCGYNGYQSLPQFYFHGKQNINDPAGTVNFPDNGSVSNRGFQTSDRRFGQSATSRSSAVKMSFAFH